MPQSRGQCSTVCSTVFYPDRVRGGMISSRSVSEVAVMWQGRMHMPVSKAKLNAAVHAWIEDNYEMAEGVCLPRSALYDHYLDYSHQHAISPMNPASFGKCVRSVFPNVTIRRLGTRGQSKYHYYGLAVKRTSKYYQEVFRMKEQERLLASGQWLEKQEEVDIKPNLGIHATPGPTGAMYPANSMQAPAPSHAPFGHAVSISSPASYAASLASLPSSTAAAVHGGIPGHFEPPITNFMYPPPQQERLSINPTPPTLTTDVGTNFHPIPSPSLLTTSAGSTVTQATGFHGIAAQASSPCYMTLPFSGQSASAAQKSPLASMYRHESCASASSYGQASSAGSLLPQYHTSPSTGGDSVFSTWPSAVNSTEAAASIDFKNVLAQTTASPTISVGLSIALPSDSLTTDASYLTHSPSSSVVFDYSAKSSPTSSSASPPHLPRHSPLPPPAAASVPLGSSDVAAFGMSSAFTQRMARR